MKFINKILLIMTSISFGLAAHASNVGCDDISTAVGLVEIAQASSEDDSDSDLYELYQVEDTLCSALTPTDGSTVRYPNGQLATNYAGKIGATWYYPNGQLITNYAGKIGATFYYPSGQLLTNYAGKVGATIYYPNGQLATNYFMKPGATWYYANGQLLTNYAGRVGATWYHSNGQLFSNYMGKAGATWYYDDGSVRTHSGPEISADDLLDVPYILRYY